MTKKIETREKKTTPVTTKTTSDSISRVLLRVRRKKKRNFARRLKRTNLRGGEVGELGASRLQLHERKRWLGAAVLHCVGSFIMLRKDSYKIKNLENLH